MCVEIFGHEAHYNEQVELFKNLPTDVFVRKMVQVLSLKDPLVEDLLSRTQDPKLRLAIVTICSGNHEDLEKLDPSWSDWRDYDLYVPGSWPEYASGIIGRLLRDNLISVHGNLSRLYYRPPGSSSLLIEVKNPRDFYDLITLKALKDVARNHTDARNILEKELSRNRFVTRHVFAKPLKLLKAMEKFADARDHMLPDGTFSLNLSDDLKVRAGRGVLGIGIGAAAADTALSYFVPVLPPMAATAASVSASAALYTLLSWRMKHANYFKYKSSLAKINRLSRRRVSRLEQWVQAIDNRFLPRLSGTAIDLKSHTVDSLTPLPFKDEWLKVDTSYDPRTGAHHQFFSGLSQSINWLQNQMGVIRYDPLIVKDLKSLEELLSLTRRTRNPRTQRSGLANFSANYLVFTEHLAAHLAQISSLLHSIEQIRNTIDESLSVLAPSLERIESEAENAPWELELSKQSLHWSRWLERLDRWTQLFAAEGTHYQQLRDLYQDMIPQIAEVQALPESAETAKNRELILKTLLEITQKSAP